MWSATVRDMKHMLDPEDAFAAHDPEDPWLLDNSRDLVRAWDHFGPACWEGSANYSLADFQRLYPSNATRTHLACLFAHPLEKKPACQSKVDGVFSYIGGGHGHQDCGVLNYAAVKGVGCCAYRPGRCDPGTMLPEVWTTLRLLNNRSLGFAGDSVMLQLFDGFVKEFMRQPTLFRVSERRDIAQNETWSGYTKWWGAMHSLGWYTVKSLPQQPGDPVFESDVVFFKHYVYSPWDLPVLEQVDVLLYYLAFHYGVSRAELGRNNHPLADDVRDAYAFLSNFSQQAPDKVAVYKEIMSSHFGTPQGEYDKEAVAHTSSCVPHANETEAAAKQAWRLLRAQQAAEFHGVRDLSRGVEGKPGAGDVYTLPIYDTYTQIAANHPGCSAKKCDCLHNCLQPTFYWPTWAMLNLVLQNASAEAAASASAPHREVAVVPRVAYDYTKGPFAHLNCRYLLWNHC